MYRKLFLVVFTLSSYFAYAEDVIQIDLTIKNHYFDPSVIEAPAGKKVRLIVHNMDDTVEEFESHDLNREKIIPPNNKVVIIIAPLAPGSYKFLGEFHPETAQGVLNIKSVE